MRVRDLRALVPSWMYATNSVVILGHLGRHKRVKSGVIAKLSDEGKISLRALS